MLLEVSRTRAMSMPWPGSSLSAWPVWGRARATTSSDEGGGAHGGRQPAVAQAPGGAVAGEQAEVGEAAGRRRHRRTRRLRKSSSGQGEQEQQQVGVGEPHEADASAAAGGSARPAHLDDLVGGGEVGVGALEGGAVVGVDDGVALGEQAADEARLPAVEAAAQHLGFAARVVVRAKAGKPKRSVR